MAFSLSGANGADFWDQFPTTGGVTGNPNPDLGSLGMAPIQNVQEPSISTNGQPWGSQPGSQNTGINGGNLGGTVQQSPTQTGSAFGGGVKTDPTTGQVVPSSTQRWDQNYFTQNFGSPRTPQELIALESQITAAGGKVLRNASGVAGKIQTPDGRIIDVINSAGAGGNGFQWLEGDGGGAGGGGNPYGFGGFGSFVTPMGEFAPPTEQDALNSPGLQFALSEANRMGQNSAAARGTLLNGRFQQALNASNIQNALAGYGDVYNRAANTFGINYGVKTGNQDRPYSKYYDLAKLGQQAASAS